MNMRRLLATSAWAAALIVLIPSSALPAFGSPTRPTAQQVATNATHWVGSVSVTGTEDYTDQEGDHFIGSESFTLEYDITLNDDDPGLLFAYTTGRVASASFSEVITSPTDDNGCDRTQTVHGSGGRPFLADGSYLQIAADGKYDFNGTDAPDLATVNGSDVSTGPADCAYSIAVNQAFFEDYGDSNHSGMVDPDGLTIHGQEHTQADPSGADAHQASWHQWTTTTTYELDGTCAADRQAARAAAALKTAQQGSGSDQVCGPPVASFTDQPDGDTIADLGKFNFDGTASYSKFGVLTNYAWDWGDDSDGESDTDPAPQHKFTRGGDYNVQLTVTDSLAHTSVPDAQVVKVCPRDPIPTLLPAQSMSADSIKTVRVGYDALALAFNYKPPDVGVSCSFTGTGILGVHVYVGNPHDRMNPQMDIPIASVATAQLDFLSNSLSVPNCKWEHFPLNGPQNKNCVVGGSGDVLVRWHTEGFSERAGASGTGPEFYNSGPLTYYARTSSSETYAQAINEVEPMLHLVLTEHLGWINPLYMAQEPPAGLQVTDSVGRITGLAADGNGTLTQIPASMYVTGPDNYSAVILFAPTEKAYTVRILGQPGDPYSLVSQTVIPATESTPPAFATRAGQLSSAGTAFTCTVDGTQCDPVPVAVTGPPAPGTPTPGENAPRSRELTPTGGSPSTGALAASGVDVFGEGVVATVPILVGLLALAVRGFRRPRGRHLRP